MALGATDEMLHWFLLPVVGSALLLASDAVRWWQGRMDLFDPRGIIGLLGLHFFFVAPLLHVIWNFWLTPYWIYGEPPPHDWRDWLGWMALLNLVGLVFYRAAAFASAMDRPAKTVWILKPKRFWVLIFAALAVTAAAQALVYLRLGGISGYVRAFEEQKGEALAGMGWVFMISESFPILLAIAFAVYARRRRWARTWLVLLLALAAFFLLKMLFGGLRGSRSNTIWGLFWAVGIIHLTVRRIPRKVVIAGLVALFAFMYVYSFYKRHGVEGVSAFFDGGGVGSFGQETTPSVEGTLLGDLGRSDVQAFTLYSLTESSRGFEFAWGRTYLGAIALVIPKAIWPDRPYTKIREGTELLLGYGSFIPGEQQTSRVFGLAGEAMLNFGPLAVPALFFLWGLFVRKSRTWLGSLAPEDSRLLLAPFVVNLAFIALISDSDNLFFSLVKNGFLPFLVLWLSSQRQQGCREQNALRSQRA